MKKTILLTILDGCGIRNESDGNAFLNANKPNFNKLLLHRGCVPQLNLLCQNSGG